MTCGLTKTGGISAKCGRSCSGDRSTAESGCTDGWRIAKRGGHVTLWIRCEETPQTSGPEAIEDSLATGEKLPREVALRWLFVLVVSSWAVLWLLATLLGAIKR